MKWYFEVLKKYVKFSGRARRQEYWMFTLFNTIIMFVLMFICKELDNQTLYLLYFYAVLLPSLAVGARRLHDIGKSGWWMLLAFIPIVGWIILIIFFVKDGEEGSNYFGDDPKGRQGIGKARQATASYSDITHLNDGRASIRDLRCPNCGAGDFTVVGAEGAGGRVIVGALLGWLISRWIYAGKIAANWPINYKCNNCKHKFIGKPAEASEFEILSDPCVIQFERVSNFVGAAVIQIVHLNGIKIGPVKNGKTITFPTHVKHNIIFVTDQYGTAFPGHYTFEAKPGESVLVRFNRKFM